MAKIVQAALVFGVIGSLRDAPLAEQIGEVIVAQFPAKVVQAAMHPEQMPTVHGLQL